MKRDILTSPKLEEIKKQKKTARKRKVVIAVVCACTVFAGFVYLSRLPNWNIKNIKVEGNNIVATEQIASVVEAELEGNYLFFVPKTNSLFYPRKNISQKLSEEFKRLKNISIDSSDLQTLEISVSERDIAYTWCGETAPETWHDNPKNGICYFVDSSGFIFDHAPYFSGNVYFRLYGKTEVAPGSTFEPNNFHRIIFYKDNLEKLGLIPVAVEVKENDWTVFLKKGAQNNSPKILIKSDMDERKIIENLSSALRAEKLGNSIKNDYDKLNYIDLRFDNKVYYKFNE